MLVTFLGVYGLTSYALAFPSVGIFRSVRDRLIAADAVFGDLVPYADWRVRGRSEGRDVRLAWNAVESRTRLAVRLAEDAQPPSFVAARSTSWLLGQLIDADDYDADGDAPTGERARRLLGELLSPGPAWRVAVEDGELVADLGRLLSPGSVEGALARLSALAALLEAAPARMRVRLGSRLVVTRRCPYCHDAIGRLEATDCGGCGARHHAACLAENGGCTVYGCGGGERPRRGPVRIGGR